MPLTLLSVRLEDCRCVSLVMGRVLLPAFRSSLSLLCKLHIKTLKIAGFLNCEVH